MQDLTYELILETDLLQLTIQAEEFHIHNLGYAVKGHLEVQLDYKTFDMSMPPAFGILGQTIDASLAGNEPVSCMSLSEDPTAESGAKFDADNPAWLSCPTSNK